MVHFNPCMPIQVGCDTLINHAAFNGTDYFCTMQCRCEIIRFNRCGCVLQRYHTCREYDCICYDWHDNCFWASSKTSSGRIFNLDCCMNEIDCTAICRTEQYGMITGISYNCCKNTILVSLPCMVLEIKKECGRAEVIYMSNSYWIIDLLCTCPYMLLTVRRCNKYCVLVIDECMEETGSFCMEEPCGFANLIFDPCTHKRQEFPIQAFVLKKSRYPYLCSTNITYDDPGFIPDCCNYEICKSCDCNDNHCCHVCDPEKDIMESIALMEASLAHILNAEGEKIQKIAASSQTAEEMLAVNKSVESMLNAVTRLEMVLQGKLELFECHICKDSCCKK